MDPRATHISDQATTGHRILGACSAAFINEMVANGVPMEYAVRVACWDRAAQAVGYALATALKDIIRAGMDQP